MCIMRVPKISIIIPIYKVEKYIDRCVKSVIDQTYKNLEIILIDDGSPDNCPVICDEWAQRDCRIKVIHKKNGGLSDARNAGIKIASGELIGFVDGDDWISEDMYQLLYENMNRNGSDISACGVKIVWNNETNYKLLTPPGECVLSRREGMEAIIRESKLKQPVWYKLYKIDVVRGVLFPINKYHEDVFWSYQVIGKADKISVFDTPCYYYFQRENSIMGTSYSLKRLDSLEAKLQRQKYIEKNFPELEELATVDLWFSSLYSMQQSLQFLSPKEYEIARKKIELIAENIFLKKCLKQLPIKQKIWLLLSKISFEKTCCLRNLLKVGL